MRAEQPGPLSDVMKSRAAMLFLAAFAIGQAVQINSGNLHPASLCAIALAMMLLMGAIVCGIRRRETEAQSTRLPSLVALLVAMQWVELLLWGLKALPASGRIAWFVMAMLIAGLGAGLMFLRSNARLTALSMLVVGYLVAGGYVIRAVPQPGEDLWQFQQASTSALLHGGNPYGVRYRNPYHPDTSFFGADAVQDGWMTYSYPYPPL